MMNDNNDRGYTNQPQSQIHPQGAYQQYNGYQRQWQAPPPKPPKKGVSGGVVAMVAAGAVCFSLFTGAMGAAAGYSLNQRATTRQIEELRAAIAALPTQQIMATETGVSLSGASDSVSISGMVENVRDSVVGIQATVTGYGYFGRPQMGTSSGSGVVVGADGYILTNNHVIDSATEVTVLFEDGESVPGKIIGTDSKTDLAVIKVEKTGLKAASLGVSGSMRVGDTVIAIGNPLGELNGTVTEGIVSAKDRPVTFDDGREMNLLQTDAAINGGNSGGALVNLNGEVIGIVVAKSSGVGVEGLGFAIPIDDAKPIIQDLIDNGYVTQRPKIGVSLYEIETDQEMWMLGVQKPGLYVAQIESGSAASNAGLNIGDLILSFNGTEITTAAELNDIRDQYKPGDTIPMVIEREGKRMTIDITLGEDKPVQERKM